MADDDRSIIKHGPLPRCHCSWKMCRTYQRAFRDYDHEVMHGVVRMKFSEYDESHRTLKEAWDQILGTDEAKKEDWKDGTCKYYVAKHHFSENMVKEMKKAKKGAWSWTETISKDDAMHLLFRLKDEFMVGEKYMKVPDVPKKVVKEMVEHVKATGILRQGSISDMSVKSTISTKSGNSSHKGKKQQLDDLLASLPSQEDEEDATPKKSKKSSSLGLEDLHKSDPNISSSSKKKKKSDGMGKGSDHSAHSAHSTRSTKSHERGKSKRSKAPKKHKSTPGKKPEDFEGELLELVDKGRESKAQETISKLQTQLFEQQSIAESALEDLEASKKECFQLREDIRSMQVKVGRVSEVIQDTGVDEMEKLRLSLSSTLEMHSVERDSLTSKTTEQDARIKQLEEQLRKEKGKTRKLEMERMKAEAEKNKATGLSSRRLMFVEELEQKLMNEKKNARKLERELLETLGEEKSKTAAALLEVGQAEMKIFALEKQVQELKGHLSNETQEYLDNVDDLKKRIASVEEENCVLRKSAQANNTTSTTRALPTASDADDSGRVKELEKEVKRLKDKNRKLAIAATSNEVSSPAGGGGDMTLKQAIDTLEKEKKALEMRNSNQMKAIQALEGNVSKDDLAAIEQAKKEDDLERATALLANLYFTKREAEMLKKVAEDLALPVSDEEKKSDGAPLSQPELLERSLQKKQARWWKTLDGFMGKSGYVKSAQTKRSSNLVE